MIINWLRSWVQDKELEKQGSELSNSGLFDPEFYLRRYYDVRAAAADPLTHFMRHGAFEGRHPSAQFDTAFYLGTNPDVKAAGVNPLLHYIRWGRTEGRVIRPLPAPAPSPVAPPAAEWQRLERLSKQRRQPAGADDVIDIVMPVYGGYHETANCLHALIEAGLAAATPGDIVVVDDRGPEPEISDLVDDLAKRGLVTLLRNERNLGFVASINRGLALHATRDVIILNSDTEVYGDWVQRMRRAAYSDARIGTVTPFSNNGTFCSYPHINQDFDSKFEIPFAEIDGLAAMVNAGRVADLPSGRGFCMYIRRQCLGDVGRFDEAAFGRGYGEETDFCQRAAAKGWRNVLAADVFVRHLGQVSFAEEFRELAGSAVKVLDQRYPEYREAEHRFVQDDPLLPLKWNLDVARIRKSTSRRLILHVVHHRHGGTMKHVNELTALLAREGVDAVLLRTWPGDPDYAELACPGTPFLGVAHKVDIKRNVAAAAALLKAIGVFHIHVHHYMDFPLAVLTFIQDVSRELGIAYDFTMHDYFPVCPRGTMIGSSGIYCNNSDAMVCQACVDRNGTAIGRVDIADWRAKNASFLAHARRVYVPNEDLIPRLRKFLPATEFTLRPHTEIVPPRLNSPVPRQRGERLRVAVIGIVGVHKGSRVVSRLARNAARRRLPIQFVPVGFDASVSMTRLPSIDWSAASRYAEKDLPALLADLRCHIALFPAVWPETYCYALTQAWMAGLYPVAFDIGAIAQRIGAIGWGHVLPFAMATKPWAVNNALLSLQIPEMPSDLRAAIASVRYEPALAAYYGLEPSQGRA